MKFKKHINFIYSLRVIRIMEFNRTEPTCYSTIFSLRQFLLVKCSFFIHRTTPDIHPRLDSRIDRNFSIARATTNNENTTTTETPPKNGQKPIPPGGLNPFTHHFRHRFCFC